MVKRTTVREEERLPLSKARVLEAAIELADAFGIDSLTMRRLAESLGAEAMSLYHHIANKDELLEGMIDVVAAEIDLPESGASWRRGIRERAISAHRIFLRHPWVTPLWVSDSAPGPARLRYMESGLRILREAGFSAELTYDAFHAVENYLVGYALQEMSFQFNEADLQAQGGAFLDALPADEYPYLGEHIRQHLEAGTLADEDEFVFGFDLILDGLERTRSRGWGRIISGRR